MKMNEKTNISAEQTNGKRHTTIQTYCIFKRKDMVSCFEVLIFLQHRVIWSVHVLAAACAL